MGKDGDAAAVGSSAGVSRDGVDEVDEEAFPDVESDVVDVEEEDWQEESGESDVCDVEDAVAPSPKDA